MTKGEQNAIGAVERAVNRLVSKCRKDGSLYAEDPKAVAQVSRTGKWLLNAIAKLTQGLAAIRKDETS